MADDAGLDLYWVPLGAGTRIVPVCGRMYEAVVARRDRRTPKPLFHAALVARLPGAAPVTVEVAPEAGGPPGHRASAVAGGAVGSRLLGRSRLFRYEVRRWPGGVIPDLGHAVGGAHTLTRDGARTALVLDALPRVPTPVWGRDELRTGDMWNSNSVVSWALASAGLAVEVPPPPQGGRAPGWDAGLAAAARDRRQSSAAE